MSCQNSKKQGRVLFIAATTHTLSNDPNANYNHQQNQTHCPIHRPRTRPRPRIPTTCSCASIHTPVVLHAKVIGQPGRRANGSRRAVHNDAPSAACAALPCMRHAVPLSFI